MELLDIRSIQFMKNLELKKIIKQNFENKEIVNTKNI